MSIFVKPTSIQYANGTPLISRIVFRAFVGPLSPISAPVSLRYVGTAELKHPIAKPVTRRPTMSCTIEYEEAYITAPKTAARLPRRIVPRRPMRKVSGRIANAVTQAARSYKAVIMGIVHTSRGGAMASRKGGCRRTPPRTPVSYCRGLIPAHRNLRALLLTPYIMNDVPHTIFIRV